MLRLKKDFDEITIIQGLKQNKESALDKCIDYYFRYIATIVENITANNLNASDKEEIVSGVFISLWNHRHNIDTANHTSLKGYLAAIARNSAKNYLKKVSGTRTVNIDDIIHISSDKDIPKENIQKEILQLLNECIQELSKEEKICILLYYFYDKSVQQIQVETGLKENTIKSKLSRSRSKLKNKLEERGINYDECKIFFE